MRSVLVTYGLALLYAAVMALASWGLAQAVGLVVGAVAGRDSLATTVLQIATAVGAVFASGVLWAHLTKRPPRW